MRLLVLALGLVAALGAGVAPAEQRAPAAEGVLLTSRSGPLSDSGLVLVTPDGRTQRLLRGSWTPVFPAGRRGPFAVEPRGRFTDPRPLVVVDGARTARIDGSAGARCVSWSPDARRLSYLTGTETPLENPSSRGWAISGTLWVVARDAVSSPQAIDTGLFPWKQCPSWAPRGESLAYVVSRSAAAPKTWSLVVLRGGERPLIAELDAAVPSPAYRTFDWEPRTGRLVFLDRETLFEWRNGAVVQLGRDHALTAVGAAPPDRFLHSVRFSPNGALLAASIGRETAVLTSAGGLVRVVAGTFNGWAGNSGLLTLRAERSGITLRLHRLRPPHGGRVIKRFFKSNIVSDPRGRWFAYIDRETASIDFRRPDGSLLRRVRMRFDPWIVAGVARDGRIIEPASAY